MVGTAGAGRGWQVVRASGTVTAVCAAARCKVQHRAHSSEWAPVPLLPPESGIRSESGWDVSDRRLDTWWQTMGEWRNAKASKLKDDV